jgi:hypothetical protein
VEERLSFYIKPMDGLQLPAIMRRLKQTFTVRFNLRTERTGHVWGDRYWSRVLEGEPPEGAGEVDWEVAAVTGVLSSAGRPLDGISPPAAENPAETGFSPQTPAPIRAESPIQPPRALPPHAGHGRGLPAPRPRRRLL